MNKHLILKGNCTSLKISGYMDFLLPYEFQLTTHCGHRTLIYEGQLSYA